MRARFDAVVVGCGAMGSAVSYNLAKRGLRVVNIERFNVNHKLGSSHGGTRIIRMAYFEDPRYVPLLRRAYRSWRELEARSGKRLLTVTGGLMIGRPEGELVRGVLRSANEHRIPHRVLSRAEMSQEYPVFALDGSMCAVREEEAGVLAAEECVKAFVGEAGAEGCEFRSSERVLGWDGQPGGVEVRTDAGAYSADHLVFCAGPWTSSLLPGLVPTKCERQVPFWFSPSPGGRMGPEEMPVFICEEGGGSLFYGIPDMGDGVKIARTHGGEECEPDSVRREVTAEDQRPVLEFIGRRMRGVAVPPTASTTCIYTNTPDLNFAIGRVPGDDRVTVVSACSGHGFKFSSVLGEVAAEIALDGEASMDVGFIGLERFDGRASSP